MLLPKRIALDGANIAWSLGTTVRSRFKCRQFPLSAGVVRALEYEPWLRQGFDVVAFIPKEYVIGGLQSLADGGGRATLNADKVKYVGKGVWVNTELMDLVDAGKVRMVSRGAGTEGRKSDDLTIIEYAKVGGHTEDIGASEKGAPPRAPPLPPTESIPRCRPRSPFSPTRALRLS